jgi:hypothetical protein
VALSARLQLDYAWHASIFISGLWPFLIFIFIPSVGKQLNRDLQDERPTLCQALFHVSSDNGDRPLIFLTGHCHFLVKMILLRTIICKRSTKHGRNSFKVDLVLTLGNPKCPFNVGSVRHATCPRQDRNFWWSNELH